MNWPLGLPINTRVDKILIAPSKKMNRPCRGARKRIKSRSPLQLVAKPISAERPQRPQQRQQSSAGSDPARRQKLRCARDVTLELIHSDSRVWRRRRMGRALDYSKRLQVANGRAVDRRLQWATLSPGNISRPVAALHNHPASYLGRRIQFQREHFLRIGELDEEKEE